ncbi:MAG: hypothetical protein KDE48_15945 [Anaerolineales bacterium]|nr:hypothetical protein [Anaerolineales bacterium]
MSIMQTDPLPAWCEGSCKRPFLNLLVRHDDAEREYAYDASAELVQQTAQERGWTTISMKNDWQTVF